MRNRPLTAAVGTFALIAGGWEPGAAAPETPAKWVVNAEDTRCTLTRLPATPSDLTFKLRVDPIDKHSVITLLSPGAKSDLVRYAKKAELELSPTARRFEGSAYGPHYASEPGYGVVFTADDPDIPATLGRSSGLAVWVKGRKIAALEFNALAAMQALKTCNDDFLQSIGVDPKAIAALGRPPRALGNGYLAQWISDGDYPVEALDANAEGETTILLIVGSDGRAQRCLLVKSAGHKSLDQQTCAIFYTRARFSPATDKAGRPIDAPLLTTVRWIIPND